MKMVEDSKQATLNKIKKLWIKICKESEYFNKNKDIEFKMNYSLMYLTETTYLVLEDMKDIAKEIAKLEENYSS